MKSKKFFIGCSIELYYLLHSYSCHQVLSADVALQEVKAGNLDPAYVLVIQHGTDDLCHRLIRSGAIPFMLVMFESPLYAGKFYDHFRDIERSFLYSQIFKPLSEESNRRRSVRFPSFSLANLTTKSNYNWESRNFLCMVVSNKYVALQSLIDAEDIGSFFWILLNKIRQMVRGNPSPKTMNLRELQLQNKRLEAIIFFSRVDQFKLYGHGWNALWRIPPRYRRQFALNFARGICAVDNKIDTLSGYKFNICFENVRYPGYVTEKIFDAMIANTIPIYYGAPDIEDFVPVETFIDASKFESFEELHHTISNLSTASANAMLDAGQKFLHSNDGMQFSIEIVGSLIHNKIEAYINDCKIN